MVFYLSLAGIPFVGPILSTFVLGLGVMVSWMPFVGQPLLTAAMTLAA
jgi:hypothetical protein